MGFKTSLRPQEPFGFVLMQLLGNCQAKGAKVLNRSPGGVWVPAPLGRQLRSPSTAGDAQRP